MTHAARSSAQPSANQSTTIPDADEMSTLGRMIANAGFPANEAALCQVVDIATTSGLYPAAVEALLDAAGPDVLRSRAFATIAHNWDEIVESAGRWDRFGTAFDHFLACWNDHEQIRKSNDIAKLWESHDKLDHLRLNLVAQRPAQPSVTAAKATDTTRIGSLVH